MCLIEIWLLVLSNLSDAGSTGYGGGGGGSPGLSGAIGAGERERGGRERERLAAAQANVAVAEVRQRCVETVREVERRRGEAEEGDRETHAQVRPPGTLI